MTNILVESHVSSERGSARLPDRDKEAIFGIILQA